MGEAPQALECYHYAADCADTLRSDCDYNQLVRVYGQMSALFYDQMLPYEYLEALRFQHKYAMLAKDTLLAINAYGHTAGAYELLGDEDSVISIREKASYLYKQYGDHQDAALIMGTLIGRYLNKGELQKARKCIDIYEEESGAVINGEVDKGRATYYYFKGLYHLECHHLDSAKILFSKLLSTENSKDQIESGYRGMYLLYKQIGDKDSLAKYADLSYQMNNANYEASATTEMRHMQALYNYNRSQAEALTLKEKAEDRKLQLSLLLFAMVVLILVAITIGYHIKKEKDREIDRLHIQYAYAKQFLEQAKRDIAKMKEKQFEKIINEKNVTIAVLEQNVKEYENSLKIRKTKAGKEELLNTDIYKRIQYILRYPNKKMYPKDWADLRATIDQLIPSFRYQVNTAGVLKPEDYNLCMLVRLYFSNSEISALTEKQPSTISMKRSRLLKKIFHVEGKPEEFDKRIQEIF